MKYDHSDFIRNIQNLQQESAIYIRQLNFLLGGTSAAGLVALLNFVGGKQNPTAVLVWLAPSYLSFILAIVVCGLTVFCKSRADEHLARHLGASHNIEELNNAIAKIPQVFASPQRGADEANKNRDEMIEKSKNFHGQAEKAWSQHRFWKSIYIAAFLLSALAFIIGAAWPIIGVLQGEQIPL
jgi:hypothetical protein